MSPRSRCGARCSIVSSTGAPALTIIKRTRGAASYALTCSRSCDCGCHRPVVTDDEVVPEAAEGCDPRPGLLHHSNGGAQAERALTLQRDVDHCRHNIQGEKPDDGAVARRPLDAEAFQRPEAAK